MIVVCMTRLINLAPRDTTYPHGLLREVVEEEAGEEIREVGGGRRYYPILWSDLRRRERRRRGHKHIMIDREGLAHRSTVLIV